MKKIKRDNPQTEDSSEFQKICPRTEPVYLEILRKMEGEQRLKTAFELYEIALNLCKQSIIEQYPSIKQEELKKELFERFGYGSGRSTDQSRR